MWSDLSYASIICAYSEYNSTLLKTQHKSILMWSSTLIDEVGYLSYGTRHADLLFEIISRRYEVKPTIITTNKPFSEWGEVFPSASCVVSLVDRLIHHSEIIVLEGESYRMMEAQERADKKKRSKRTPPSKKK